MIQFMKGYLRKLNKDEISKLKEKFQNLMFKSWGFPFFCFKTGPVLVASLAYHLIGKGEIWLGRMILKSRLPKGTSTEKVLRTT